MSDSTGNGGCGTSSSMKMELERELEPEVLHSILVYNCDDTRSGDNRGGSGGSGVCGQQSTEDCPSEYSVATLANPTGSSTSKSSFKPRGPSFVSNLRQFMRRQQARRLANRQRQRMTSGRCDGNGRRDVKCKCKCKKKCLPYRRQCEYVTPNNFYGIQGTASTSANCDCKKPNQKNHSRLPLYNEQSKSPPVAYASGVNDSKSPRVPSVDSKTSFVVEPIDWDNVLICCEIDNKRSGTNPKRTESEPPLPFESDCKQCPPGGQTCACKMARRSGEDCEAPCNQNTRPQLKSPKAKDPIDECCQCQGQGTQWQSQRGCSCKRPKSNTYSCECKSCCCGCSCSCDCGEFPCAPRLVEVGEDGGGQSPQCDCCPKSVVFKIPSHEKDKNCIIDDILKTKCCEEDRRGGCPSSYCPPRCCCSLPRGFRDTYSKGVTDYCCCPPYRCRPCRKQMISSDPCEIDLCGSFKAPKCSITRIWNPTKLTSLTMDYSPAPCRKCPPLISSCCPCSFNGTASLQEMYNPNNLKYFCPANRTCCCTHSCVCMENTPTCETE